MNITRNNESQISQHNLSSST